MKIPWIAFELRSGCLKITVKKVRVIPRRKLRSTYSLRSAMYIEAGAQYVRRVSSLVKNGMNSLKLASFPLQSEGLCSLQHMIIFSWFIVIRSTL